MMRRRMAAVALRVVVGLSLLFWLGVYVAFDFFNAPQLQSVANRESLCGYDRWLPAYARTHRRVVAAMLADCAGYWRDVGAGDMPGLLVVRCGHEAGQTCQGFGDQSNALAGALFYAVQTDRALFALTGMPEAARFFASTHMEWRYHGAIAECVEFGQKHHGGHADGHHQPDGLVWTGYSDRVLGLQFPQRSWLKHLYLMAGFTKDIGIQQSTGHPLPPALVLNWNTMTEYRFLLGYFGQPLAAVSVRHDDYRYVYTYGCLLRVLYEKPTEALEPHVRRPVQLMRSASVSVAVHLRFGDANMDAAVVEASQRANGGRPPDDRRLAVTFDTVRPYCDCAWRLGQHQHAANAALRPAGFGQRDKDTAAYGPDPSKPLHTVVFAISDSASGAGFIRTYFSQEVGAAEAVWDPLPPGGAENALAPGRWATTESTQPSMERASAMATDNSGVLAFTTAGAPKHVYFAANEFASDVKAMADWFIASQADVFVASRSGFSFSSSARSLRPTVTLFQCWLSKLTSLT